MILCCSGFPIAVILTTGGVMDAKLDNDGITKEKATLKLLMYSAVPAQDSAWLAGFESAHSDIGIDENPFKLGDYEYRCWEDGWWQGFYDLDYTAKELSDELEVYKNSFSASNSLNSASKNLSKTNTQSRVKNDNASVNKIMLLISVIILGLIGVSALIVN